MKAFKEIVNDMNALAERINREMSIEMSAQDLRDLGNLLADIREVVANADDFQSQFVAELEGSNGITRSRFYNLYFAAGILAGFIQGIKEEDIHDFAMENDSPYAFDRFMNIREVAKKILEQQKANESTKNSMKDQQIEEEVGFSL